jgi:hypothetical protein
VCGGAVSNWLVPGATSSFPTMRSPSHARRATTLTPWPTRWDSDAPKRATRPMANRPAAAFGCWSEPSASWVSDRSRVISPAQGVGVTRRRGPGSRSRSVTKGSTPPQTTTEERCPRRPNDPHRSCPNRSRLPNRSRPANRSRPPNRFRPPNRCSHPSLDRAARRCRLGGCPGSEALARVCRRIRPSSDDIGQHVDTVDPLGSPLRRSAIARVVRRLF